MVLTDREITARAANGLLEEYDPDCITNIGYDLRADHFVSEGKKHAHMKLRHGESAFVGTKENIRLPDDMLGRIVLKNSRLRQGLSIDAPVYQPGHYTKVFFRVTNVSGNEIELQKDGKYATILFETLSGPVGAPYTGTFSDEMDYSGLGKYTDIYQDEIKQIEKKTENLKDMERTIYANVLVILTVFVALFSFITTNLSLLSSSADTAQFLIYNFVMLGCISFLVALLNGVVSFAKSHWIPWIASIVSFLIAIVLFFMN